jgi:hypothetical protein
MRAGNFNWGEASLLTAATAAHVPDMKEIAESARRFGAQIPLEKNRKRAPLFAKGRARGSRLAWDSIRWKA